MDFFKSNKVFQVRTAWRVVWNLVFNILMFLVYVFSSGWMLTMDLIAQPYKNASVGMFFVITGWMLGGSALIVWAFMKRESEPEDT